MLDGVWNEYNVFIQNVNLKKKRGFKMFCISKELHYNYFVQFYNACIHIRKPLPIISL